MAPAHMRPWRELFNPVTVLPVAIDCKPPSHDEDYLLPMTPSRQPQENSAAAQQLDARPRRRSGWLRRLGRGRWPETTLVIARPGSITAKFVKITKTW